MKLQPIKLLLALFVALMPIHLVAQTNTTYVKGTDMPTVTIGASDIVIFQHWNGSKFVWAKMDAPNFFDVYTNFPAGQDQWTAILDRALTSDLTTSSNALQAQVTANSGAITTSSNALQAQITSNAGTITTSSNALQAQITANAGAITTSSNALQAQITSNDADISALQTKTTAATNRFVFQSTDLSTFTATNVTHGLAGTPRLYWSIVNLTSDAGYSPGDEVSGASVVTADVTPWSELTVGANSTSIYAVRYSGQGIRIGAKTTGTQTTITPADWALKITAKYP